MEQLVLGDEDRRIRRALGFRLRRSRNDPRGGGLGADRSRLRGSRARQWACAWRLSRQWWRNPNDNRSAMHGRRQRQVASDPRHER